MSNQRKISDGYSQRGALTKTRILMKFLTSFLNITMKMKDRTDFFVAMFSLRQKSEYSQYSLLIFKKI